MHDERQLSYLGAQFALIGVLLSLLAPWVTFGDPNPIFVANGLDFALGISSGEIVFAPSIIFDFAIATVVITLLSSFFMERRGGASIIVGGGIVAAVFVVIALIMMLLSSSASGPRAMPAIGFWLALAALAVAFFIGRMSASKDWRADLPDPLRPYLEKAPLAALALGVSSGFPFAMIAATLTTRLKQDGITKATVTAFSLAILVYNLKFLWSWMVDGVRLPVIGRMGQRVSWMLFAGALVIAAVANLALADPKVSIAGMAMAAILVGLAGATFDTVIDAYRIELLEPRQLGVGSGMAQYGYRIGNVGAASLALLVAASSNWTVAYLTCCLLALPAMLTALALGEPPRRKVVTERRSVAQVLTSIWGPFAEFFKRRGALIVLIFILVHKVGDTLANLTFRLLFDDLKFTNAEIAGYDVFLGFWAYMIGIFIGGILYAKLGMKRSVLISLVLMAVSNISFAALAAAGHSNIGMAGAIGFENIASGYGGVVVTAYFSALTDLRFTAAQYALISAAASIVGRLLTGTTAGALIDSIGYVQFYILTTIIALPGVLIFWWMMRSGLVDEAIGSAGTEPAKDEPG